MKFHSILYPVQALDPAIGFFVDAMGMPLLFRDGDRYAALASDGLSIGLAAGEERIVEQPAIVFRSASIGADVARLSAAGATLLTQLKQGPHELRAVFRTPGDQLLVLTAKLR